MWINPLALKFGCTGASGLIVTALWFVLFLLLNITPQDVLAGWIQPCADIMRSLENPLTSFKTH